MKLEGWIAYDDTGEWIASRDRHDVVENTDWIKNSIVKIEEITITIPPSEEKKHD